jgi:hypothetical protein
MRSGGLGTQRGRPSRQTTPAGIRNVAVGVVVFRMIASLLEKEGGH